VNRLEKRLHPDGRSVKEFIEENYNVSFGWMTDASTLIPKAYEALNPGKHVARRVEDYYDEYGVDKLILIK